ncbi:unnamed protein product [Amaranthus hypochondriacus]
MEQPSAIAPRPDKFTYPFVVKACSRLKDTKLGKQVHCLICKVGFDSDRDVVSWTSVIDGLVDNGRGIEAIKPRISSNACKSCCSLSCNLELWMSLAA